MRRDERGDRAVVADGAQCGGESIGHGGRARRAIVQGDVVAEAALDEHGAIERQRQVPRQLLLEQQDAGGAIDGERGRHRRRDLKAVERPSRPRSPAAKSGHRHALDVRRRGQPQHDAVGDLSGQLEHLRAERGEKDRRRRRQARQPALPVRPIARAVVLHLAGERRAQHAHVLAHHVERARHVEAETARHRGRMAHADAEHEAAARDLRQRQRLLREQHGMARIDRDHAGPEAGARRHVRIGGQGQERVAADAMRHPDAVVAERVRALRQGNRRPEIGAGIEKEGSRHD